MFGSLIDFTREQIKAIQNYANQDEYLEMIVRTITDNLHISYAEIYLMDTTKEWISLSAGSAKFSEFLIKRGRKARIVPQRNHGFQVETAVSLGEIRLTMWHTGEILGYSLPSGESASTPSDLISKDKIAPFHGPEISSTASELYLLIRRDRQIIGALVLYSNDKSSFEEKEIGALQTIADEIETTIKSSFEIDSSGILNQIVKGSLP
jgi:hypothetical protein